MREEAMVRFYADPRPLGSPAAALFPAQSLSQRVELVQQDVACPIGGALDVLVQRSEPLAEVRQHRLDQRTGPHVAVLIPDRRAERVDLAAELHQQIVEA